MKIFNLFLLFSLCFIGGQFAQAKFQKSESKGIPYCSKKISRGCVKRRAGQTTKLYHAPDYSKKKLAQNSKHPKVKKQKRSTASVLQVKLKKKKKYKP